MSSELVRPVPGSPNLKLLSRARLPQMSTKRIHTRMDIYMGRDLICDMIYDFLKTVVIKLS